MKGFNGSTAPKPWCLGRPIGVSIVDANPLQWVHGTQALVSVTLSVTVPALRLLQWVHGTQAVVSKELDALTAQVKALQWVHGTQAVVSLDELRAIGGPGRASMGPRHPRRSVDVCVSPLPHP